ncbi:DUF502 domain-containing protein [Varunaivibrio sulfuroxidans]|uniref:Putative membrane protein n=1 Tax=Varunaivibrio sulfuroxidans TaxID=1773489 RepID=A0A4R3JF07_9PROT|nr:DUF502 domain-containing protein [Varunaivibrio sulfuroxidans]TCS64387.1 putative membrane protein [Varunaivibrio sulfuroxidans]WES31182.1 DUF502 domain-containing protein [Varunaivibrio sulfuroxidans]
MNSDDKKNSGAPHTQDGTDAPLGSVRLGIGARLRAYFFAGILITAPITLTFYIAWLFVTYVDSKVTPLIPLAYRPEHYLPFAIPGLGLLIVIVSLILIGALTAGFLGRLYQRTVDGVLSRMPVIRGLYGSLKQILETVLAQQSNAFREAVLVEYPRRGVWAIGFITGQTQGEVQNLTEEDVLNVFLPTTPNPTSGFLLFLPRKEIVTLSMSVEEAVKMVISGGIVTPLDRRPKDVRDKSVVSAATYEDVDILRERDRAPVLVASPHEPSVKNSG